ncbi:MAG: hypothetical protein J7K57_09545 [Palaeococcus sp.]|uniref:hypothetical protein n=1 Tax=Palaeococcus sp. (in: euryarchaeotes) TaxID=2820298 RepID=UPI0025F3F5BE|nr:hypothetical protein [Palaeococcus sp. (in: euryarchaeotes)]MCD6560086.1 hypothetical protein [Palaeococcus sp. (in: euryarchaeotes)]
MIAYDRRSLGWILGLRIFKALIENGAIGVVLNTVLPVSKLELRLERAGVDLHKTGEEGKLYVIDLFGSKYEIYSKEPYIFQIQDWSDETGLAKLINLYRELSSRISKDALVAGLITTMEGTYHEFGERMMNRIVRASIASFEREPLSDLRIITISLLNKEAVPDYINAWLFSLNDQVIELISHVSSMGMEETILVPKSVLPGFTPCHYRVVLSKEQFIKLF